MGKRTFNKISFMMTGIIAVVFVVAVCYARENTNRHEISADVRWDSWDYTYDHYIISAQSFPAVSGERHHEYQYVVSSYSFFLTPISLNTEFPYALERFYAHPSLFTVSFSLQPEYESQHQFRNSEQGFHSVTNLTPRSRQVNVSFEYYLWKHTGVLVSLSSAKYEGLEQFSDSLGNQRDGEYDEIRRSYSVGLSRYLSPSLNLRLIYTALDGEYLGYERDLEHENPFIQVESREDADTDGYAISARVAYVFKKRWKISGEYEFQQRERRSHLFSPYYQDLPDSILLQNDDQTSHTIQTSLTAYLTGTTSFYAGGQFGWDRQERTYSTDLIIEREENAATLEAGLTYEVNRHIGIRFGYEFSLEDGDVLYWYTASDQETTYQTRSDEHKLSCGVTGRF